MADQNDSSPHPLNYEPPQRRGRRQFWTAVIVGSSCSLIFWTCFMILAEQMRHPFVPIFVFLTAKLVAGILLSSSSRWKSAGGGLFISLGVGALIFLGTCGIAIVKWTG